MRRLRAKSWRTIDGRFRRWIAKELFEALMRVLARRQRRHCSCRSDPRLALRSAVEV
ncbi:Hypothetical protein MexAM1_META1p0917 [Methylorubrum extorquens AM1]|uniref:Uncharacterized protein n=1 Tax=Methylorubrum extorquens (strain ATCC 14718 / DSM 1338 / JCM 2805 / NCIMB 9133 / AM1) TaxID=272630 RepID=C5AWJ0_METEA|nr:Hypothetical protein MexAM1_META1p0917 [Methylorubrum extorquens AM1]